MRRALLILLAALLLPGEALAVKSVSTLPTFGPLAQSTAPPSRPEPSDRQQRERALDGLRRDQRSGKAAVFMTMVFPGWGQLYADSPFWATAAFGAQMWFLGNFLMEARRVERHSVRRDREAVGTSFRSFRDSYVEEHRERSRDFVWWSVAGFFVISLDAYVSVELADFDAPDPPTPDLDKDWDRGLGTDDDAGEGVALRLDFDF